MQYEDKIAIQTPEGIAIEYTLAGAGSRFIAELVDILLRLALLAAITLVLALTLDGTSLSKSIALIVAIVVWFAIWFGYDVLFEVWGAGRTPGKRWSGLRVVGLGGEPVGLAASSIRTLMRIIDVWATLAIAGTASIMATKRNQRLGDLAAGTIVIRERRERPRGSGAAAFPVAGAAVGGAADGAAADPARWAPARAAAGLDVTAVGAAELGAVNDFLARRGQLTAAARERVADALARGLEPKVGGLPPGGLQPEFLLEAIAAAKTGSGRAAERA